MTEAEAKLQKIRGLLDALETALKEMKAILRGIKE